MIMKSLLKFSFLFILVAALSNCTRTHVQNTDDGPIEPVAQESEYDGTALEDAFNKLNSGESLSATEIKDFSADLLTRASFYRLLSDFNKESLFPDTYLTFEKAAESVLTNWLVYPTELDTVPSQIELIKKVDYVKNDTTYIYYVFQFKTDPPHWSAKDGWMTGVVGPYFADSHPYDWTTGTFSKFTKKEETTPELEVEWIHKNVYLRRPE